MEGLCWQWFFFRLSFDMQIEDLSLLHVPSLLCKLCSKKGRTTEAVVHCTECKTLLCTNHKEVSRTGYCRETLFFSFLLAHIHPFHTMSIGWWLWLLPQVSKITQFFVQNMCCIIQRWPFKLYRFERPLLKGMTDSGVPLSTTLQKIGLV